jgi:hypothetical protein
MIEHLLQTQYSIMTSYSVIFLNENQVNGAYEGKVLDF